MSDSNPQNSIKGKRILLIALPGYPDGIIAQMEKMGATVDYIPDKPNEGFACKTLGRLQVGFYLKVLNKYYLEKISQLSDRHYDYILVIRGEYTTEYALAVLKDRFPNARLVLYMWDGMHKQNTKGIEKKWPFYDKVYTFDRIDYETYKDDISFLPLYYYEEYLPKNLKTGRRKNYRYDISFIGTAHADRVRIVKDVMRQCRNKGYRTFSYFYMPHPFIYLWNKLTNKDFKNVVPKDIHYKMLPFEKLYKIYGCSGTVIDVENPGQHGLTMRSIEIIGLRKKLITTNKDIVHYDFYDPDNIYVIDRKNPVIDLSFLDKEYKELPAEIYEKYSLKNWILEVLK